MFNIVVGVGPKQKTFTVYNDVIIPRSEFFRAARSNTWIKDDPTRPTSLEHEDPETFAAYLHAVNYDRIRIEGLHVYETGYFEENAAFVEEFSKHYATTPFEVLHLLKSTERYLRLMKLYILSNMLLKTGCGRGDSHPRPRHVAPILLRRRALVRLYDRR
jgi:hypothetical protein